MIHSLIFVNGVEGYMYVGDASPNLSPVFMREDTGKIRVSIAG